MHPYVKKIKTIYQKNAEPSQAAAMKKYMRDQFEYLGIKTLQAKALQKEFYAEHGLPEISEVDEIVRNLWDLPQREYKYAAMGLMDKFGKKLPADFIETVEHFLDPPLRGCRKPGQLLGNLAVTGHDQFDRLVGCKTSSLCRDRAYDISARRMIPGLV